MLHMPTFQRARWAAPQMFPLSVVVVLKCAPKGLPVTVRFAVKNTLKGAWPGLHTSPWNCYTNYKRGHFLALGGSDNQHLVTQKQLYKEVYLEWLQFIFTSCPFTCLDTAAFLWGKMLGDKSRWESYSAHTILYCTQMRFTTVKYCRNVYFIQSYL